MKPVEITKRNIMFPLTSEAFPDYLPTNTGLILGVKRNYLIDTGNGEKDAKLVLDYIGKTTKPLVVINTHMHGDHVWGNHVFSDNLIISHKLCREELDINWEIEFEKNKQFAHGAVKKCLPNLTFEDSLHFADDGIYLFIHQDTQQAALAFMMK